MQTTKDLKDLEEITKDFPSFLLYSGQLLDVTWHRRRNPMPTKRRSRRIDSIVKALLAYEPEAVYLFGSWARNEGDELSDVDLVIIKRTCLPFFDRLMEASKHLPASAGGVDLLVYTPEEFHTMLQEGNAFAETIAEESILIYGHKQEN